MDKNLILTPFWPLIGGHIFFSKIGLRQKSYGGKYHNFCHRRTDGQTDKHGYIQYYHVKPTHGARYMHDTCTIHVRYSYGANFGLYRSVPCTYARDAHVPLCTTVYRRAPLCTVVHHCVPSCTLLHDRVFCWVVQCNLWVQSIWVHARLMKEVLIEMHSHVCRHTHSHTHTHTHTHKTQKHKQGHAYTHTHPGKKYVYYCASPASAYLLILSERKHWLTFFQEPVYKDMLLAHTHTRTHAYTLTHSLTFTHRHGKGNSIT